MFVRNCFFYLFCFLSFFSIEFIGKTAPSEINLLKDRFEILVMTFKTLREDVFDRIERQNEDLVLLRKPLKNLEKKLRKMEEKFEELEEKIESLRGFYRYMKNMLDAYPKGRDTDDYDRSQEFNRNPYRYFPRRPYGGGPYGYRGWRGPYGCYLNRENYYPGNDDYSRSGNDNDRASEERERFDRKEDTYTSRPLRRDKQKLTRFIDCSTNPNLPECLASSPKNIFEAINSAYSLFQQDYRVKAIDLLEKFLTELTPEDIKNVNIQKALYNMGLRLYGRDKYEDVILVASIGYNFFSREDSAFFFLFLQISSALKLKKYSVSCEGLRKMREVINNNGDRNKKIIFDSLNKKADCRNLNR